LAAVARVVTRRETAAVVPEEDFFVLSSLPPSRTQKRLALAVVLALFVTFLLAAGPLSHIQTSRVAAFVPAYTTALVLSEGITAFLLFSQFAFFRTRALLVISSGYLFAALMAIAWFLMFPGVFVPEGLIGGIQGRAYIYLFWHAGFPIFVIVYAFIKDADSKKRYWNGTARAGIVLSVILTVVVVSVLTVFFAVQDSALPRLELDPLRFSPLWLYFAVPMASVIILALLALWVRRRSVLDLCLMVVMLAYVIEIWLSYFPLALAYGFGWYASRIFGLFSSSTVLWVLLYEITTLYAVTAIVRVQRAESRLAAIISSSSDAIIGKSLDGIVTSWNAGAENIFGYEAHEMIGQSITRIIPAELRQEENLILGRLREGDRIRNYETVRTRKDGSRVDVSLTVSPVFDPSGKVLGASKIARDITAEKRAEAELQLVREELARVARITTLGQLTASIAHEVTQPIASSRNNARAALNFLDRQPPDLSDVKEALECVVADADRAGDIIDRMRDHIKKAPPRKERLDLNKAINEVIALARSAITENGVSVQTRLMEGSVPVQGDRVQVQQVVLNLILNAVEAMGSVETGGRELLISTKQSETNGVVVAVGDSGPGIDPENLQRVFEAFYTTKSSGVGMGLSICRSIIEAHGGRLWAEANEPRGSIFKFTLPNGIAGAQSGSVSQFLLGQTSGMAYTPHICCHGLFQVHGQHGNNSRNDVSRNDRSYSEDCIGASMADYYPLLMRAVAALGTSTSESRHTLYDRARTAQWKQLRILDPPLTEAALEGERLALEEAIRRVETDAAGNRVLPSTFLDAHSQKTTRAHSPAAPATSNSDKIRELQTASTPLLIASMFFPGLWAFDFTLMSLYWVARLPKSDTWIDYAVKKQRRMRGCSAR
jgi:PAS domain S-box-containing protein